MNFIDGFKNKAKALSKEDFSTLAMELFHFQSSHSCVYKKYLENLGVRVKDICRLEDIPFLPIQFFKNHKVISGAWNVETIFKSSGTTGVVRSQHYIEDVEFYQTRSLEIFRSFFHGFNEEDVVLALLPSYQEQGHSSLICMVDYLMEKVNYSGYYLSHVSDLEIDIEKCLTDDRKVYLFGVGYALLDFAEIVSRKLDGLVIIETGGMKGRREELTKSEYYSILKNAMGDVQVYSEYGMTELLSQAYSFDGKTYQCSDSMKVVVKDILDPFSEALYNKTGILNVIDLANVHSCAFIETEDIGKVTKNGGFEVLGRLDNSDIRGCNLLVQ